MAKSTIIRELVNKEITLGVALSRTKVIAYNLNNVRFNKWIDKELTGYLDDDILPSYRVIDSANIFYSGKKGNMQFTHQPLPINYFSKEYRDIISKTEIRISVSAINKLLESKDSLSNDLTIFNNDVYKNTGLWCFSITKIIDQIILQPIIDNLSNILINILLELDKEFGCLDELDINTSNKTKVDAINKTIIQFIYNDNSTKMGNKNKITKSKIGEL